MLFGKKIGGSVKNGRNKIYELDSASALNEYFETQTEKTLKGQISRAEDALVQIREDGYVSGTKRLYLQAAFLWFDKSIKSSWKRNYEEMNEKYNSFINTEGDIATLKETMTRIDKLIPKLTALLKEAKEILVKSGQMMNDTNIISVEKDEWI